MACNQLQSLTSKTTRTYCRKLEVYKHWDILFYIFTDCWLTCAALLQTSNIGINHSIYGSVPRNGSNLIMAKAQFDHSSSPCANGSTSFLLPTSHAFPFCCGLCSCHAENNSVDLLPTKWMKQLQKHKSAVNAFNCNLRVPNVAIGQDMPPILHNSIGTICKQGKYKCRKVR